MDLTIIAITLLVAISLKNWANSLAVFPRIRFVLYLKRI